MTSSRTPFYWNKPHDRCVIVQVPSTASEAPAGSSGVLPVGWIQVETADGGCIYVHEATGERSRSRPTAGEMGYVLSRLPPCPEPCDAGSDYRHGVEVLALDRPDAQHWEGNTFPRRGDIPGGSHGSGSVSRTAPRYEGQSGGSSSVGGPHDEVHRAPPSTVLSPVGRTTAVELEFNAIGLGVMRMKFKGQRPREVHFFVMEITGCFTARSADGVVKNRENPHWLLRLPWDLQRNTTLVVAIHDKKKLRASQTPTYGTFTLTSNLVETALAKPREYLSSDTAKLGVLVHGTDRESRRITLKLSAENVRRADGYFGLSDPYFSIFVMERGSGSLVSVSNVVEQNLNPVWDEVSFDVETSGGELEDKQILIAIDDEDLTSLHDALGFVGLSIRDLEPGLKLPIMYGEKAGNVSCTDVGCESWQQTFWNQSSSHGSLRQWGCLTVDAFGFRS